MVKKIKHIITTNPIVRMNIKSVLNSIVARNIFYLGIGNGFTQLLSMIAVIFITKLLLPAEYGKYTFMIIQAQLIATIADLGMRNIIIRDVARSKKMKLFVPAFIIIILSNTIILSLYCCYNAFWGVFSVSQLAVIGLYSFIFCIVNLCDGLLIGMEKMFPLSVIGILFSLIWLIFVWLLPQNTISIELLFISSLLLLLFKCIALIIQLKVIEKVKLFYSITKKNISDLVKSSLPYFGLVLVALPANYLANNFLQINSTIDQIGFFSLGQKLTSPLTMLFGILFSALFPNISILWESNKDKFFSVLNKGVVYFILFASGGAFLFSVLIKPVFLLFFPDKYMVSVDICKTQIWFVCLMGICSLAGIVWGAMNKERLAFKMAVLNAAMNIPILWIGSKSGAMGLSVGYVVSFSLFMCFLWPVFVKTNKISKKKSFVWIPAVILFIASFLL